jgi:heme/copper-type cytochrome/quinol oxidase subunit 2
MNRPLTCFAIAAVALAGLSAREREQGQVREFSLTGNKHTFSPNRLEVNKDDLVKITFTAADIPHSFTSDEYRISKRAGAGQTVTFEFRADRSGTFSYYCNLSADDRCRDMKGQLVVK